MLVWSPAEEIRLLECLTAHAEAHGKPPERSELLAAAAGPDLDRFSLNQLYEKARSLRNRYARMRDNGGVGAAGGDAHKARVYELSAPVWADLAPKAADAKKGAATPARRAVKKEAATPARRAAKKEASAARRAARKEDAAAGKGSEEEEPAEKEEEDAAVGKGLEVAEPAEKNEDAAAAGNNKKKGRDYEGMQRLYPSLVVVVESIIGDGNGAAREAAIKRTFQRMEDGDAAEMDAMAKKHLLREAKVKMRRTAVKNEVLTTLINPMDMD